MSTVRQARAIDRQKRRDTCAARERALRQDYRVQLAEVDGRRHEIPEMWLVGATRDKTYAEAIQHWHEQTLLAEMHDQEA